MSNTMMIFLFFTSEDSDSSSSSGSDTDAKAPQQNSGSKVLIYISCYLNSFLSSRSFNQIYLFLLM
jgi:hypothetical protein